MLLLCVGATAQGKGGREGGRGDRKWGGGFSLLPMCVPLLVCLPCSLPSPSLSFPPLWTEEGTSPLSCSPSLPSLACSASPPPLPPSLPSGVKKGTPPFLFPFLFPFLALPCGGRWIPPPFPVPLPCSP